jgi:hypothetical protein
MAIVSGSTIARTLTAAPAGAAAMNSASSAGSSAANR